MDLVAGAPPGGGVEGFGGWVADPVGLGMLADRLSAGFRAAAPFPHVVIDGLMSPRLLRDVIDQIPPAGADGWIRHSEQAQHKRQWSADASMPPAARRLLGLLQSGTFVDFLERVTGMPGLIVDPSHLHGGLHVAGTGGHLKIHADPVLHPRLHVNRRLNLILYLNPGWRTEWGGDLELWDDGLTRCVRRIAPVCNRMVIFAAGPPAHHGHPDPLLAPPGVERCSVAVYYYASPANPAGLGVGPRLVRFRGRPGHAGELRGQRARQLLVDAVVPPAIVRWLARRGRDVVGGPPGQPGS